MSDYNALISAVHLSPDEDTPRLMLADWLIEHGDESQQARGELIQIQCELAKITYKDQVCKTCGVNCGECKSKYCPRGHGDPDGKNSHQWQNQKREELQRCEQAILTQYADVWRKGSVCDYPKCEKGHVYTGMDGMKWIRCPKCDGTGDAGGLLRRDGRDEPHPTKPDPFRYKVEYVRGMKRVHATFQECVKTVPDHDNNCRCTVPSDWLLSVVRHHPDVTEVWLTDRKPSDSYHLGTGVSWIKRRSGRDCPATLIPSLFDMVTSMDGHKNPITPFSDIYEGIIFDTTEEALITLARGVVRWAKSHEKITT